MAQSPARLWHERDFLLLWSGQTISQLGSQVTTWALPLTAVLLLHASPMQTGLLTAASIAPYIVAGLLAGAWADRVRRRPLMIAADVGRALLVMSIPLTAWIGKLTLLQLYGVAVLMGLGTIIFDVAYGAFLPSVVARHHLLDANGKLEVSNAAARIAGPGLAGILVQLFSGPTALLVDAVSFVASFSSLLLIRVRETRGLVVRDERTLWLHEVGQGIRLVATHALLRPLAVSAALFGLFDTMLVAIYVPYLVRELHIPAALLGGIFAVAGVGGLLGASLAAPVAHRAGIGRAMVGGVLLAALAEMIIAVAQGPMLLAVALVTLGEAGVQGGDVVASIANSSARQMVVEDAAQGRVTATMRVFSAGLATLGAILGGWCADHLGLRPTVVIAGVGTVVAGVLLWLSPVWQQRKLTLVPSQSGVASQEAL
ncbi:MAG: MFS transporter [Ktedonobacterales bacterium]